MFSNTLSKKPFHFEILANTGSARAGILQTPHGKILTPVFAPVGTQATVKSLTPLQLKEVGATLILANTYHLHLRPGDEIINEMGGLHKFMAWEFPILTDSGGFQVHSLSATRKIDDDGVTFKSHIDGSMKRLTPETAIKIQENLGADLIMAFDECAPPHDHLYCENAMSRTHSWAERCLAVHSRDDQALFGIVQGGIFPDLRLISAEYLKQLHFPGYAIGGLSVGESKEEMHQVLDLMDRVLPYEKPRYLMGVGTPEDIIDGVLRGIDIFDCVLPTRLARHNTAMTRKGRLNLVNAAYAHDPQPIDQNCTCYACKNFSRSYIRHLILAKEMLAATLLSIHNVYALTSLANDLHHAIVGQYLSKFINEMTSL